MILLSAGFIGFMLGSLCMWLAIAHAGPRYEPSLIDLYGRCACWFYARAEARRTFHAARKRANETRLQEMEQGA